MFSVAVTLDTFMSARLVSEMPSELARRISFRYCGTAPSTTPAMKMNMIASAPCDASCGTGRDGVTSGQSSGSTREGGRRARGFSRHSREEEGTVTPDFVRGSAGVRTR